MNTPRTTPDSWHGPRATTRASNGRVSAPPETPSERLQRLGPDALSSKELLILTLGRQGRSAPDQIARKLLRAYGTLRALSRASARELERDHGLGRATAERLAATLALGSRTHTERLLPGSLLKTSGAIFDAYHARLRDKRQEVFLCVLLDAKNRVIAEREITKGILTASLVHPREVFLPAIRECAAGVVLVHNHPSGDPEPSPEDHEVTRRLCSVGNLIGIRVLDHLVIGHGTYVSFLERGLLD